MPHQDNISKTIRGYHFTKFEYGISNIKNERLKIARILELNDPFEFRNVIIPNDEDGHKKEDWVRELDSQCGIVCFSKSYANPTMWGHYAENATGLVLGFDLASPSAKEVKYKNQFLELPGDGEKDKRFFTEELISTKSTDWEYETELRMYASLDASEFDERNNKFMYFLPFSDEMQLREVFLGPECKVDKSDIEQIKRYVNHPEVEVFRTSRANDRFQILNVETL